MADAEFHIQRVLRALWRRKLVILLLAAVVNCSHLSATRGAEARRGDSCSRESYDQHAFAIEFDSGMHPYLSFSVVSEKSAKTSATIQKRTMIFDSLQPASSK